MKILLLLLLFVAALLIAGNFFHGRLRRDAGETRDFLCPGMTGFAFRYALSPGWRAGRTQKVSMGCGIFLDGGKFSTPFPPYISVQEFSQEMIPDAKNAETNPHGVPYIRRAGEYQIGPDTTVVVTVRDPVDFFLPHSVIRIGLQFYGDRGSAPVKLLDKELFWKTVIESFRRKDGQ